MTTSIQKMQSNDFLRSSASSPFMESSPLLSNNFHSQLNMLYALTQQHQQQQQQQQISPPDSKIKRIKKSMSLSNDLPTQVPLISATETACLTDREVVKVVTTAGPQCVDKDFLTQLLTRKDVIPARKRRDFIPNDMKDDHYWERRRKNNLAAKRSREKRRLNDIVLETKVVELTNENEALKAKLHLMLSRINMKETDMETLFEEEQRLGHICLKPATTASTIFGSNESDNDDEYSSHEDLRFTQQSKPNNDNTAIDLSRTEVKTGNLLRKSPSPLTPSPSPPNESLLQILANQMLHTKPQETSSSRLLTIASPPETKPLKRAYNQLQQDNDQQQKWDEAAMTLLSLNKPQPPTAPVEQQVALQSVINGLLRKPNPPRATIDYHSQQPSSENFTSFEQWKTLMNYFSMPSTQQSTHPMQQILILNKYNHKINNMNHVAI
ncbi:hypothetical protein I4U23_014668 [Adineta vaga]|nr:hypothetical protein I4U23_014668 [Adineta vaga]